MSLEWSRLLSEVREKSQNLDTTPLLVREFTNINQSPGGLSKTQSSKGLSDSDGSIRIMQWNVLAQGL